jgi:hypothetical protein
MIFGAGFGGVNASPPDRFAAVQQSAAESTKKSLF